MEIVAHYVDGDSCPPHVFEAALEQCTEVYGGAFVSYVRHADGTVTAEVMDITRIRVQVG